MVLSDPPPYTAADKIEQNCIVRSDSLTQSASNIISQVLTNVGVSNNIPYLVSDAEIICSICLENMDEEEGNLFTISACSHVYHKHCIEQWKQQSNKCPCCRGPLPDILGPTLSKLQNLLVEPAIPEMTWSHVVGNMLFFLPGIVSALCLVLLLIAWESVIICVIVGPTFFAAMYILFFQEDGEGIGPTFVAAIILVIIYPIIVACFVLAFLGQIIFMLYRTMKFYYKLMMCKIRWCKAYSFIIGRTLKLTSYCFERLSQ
jgi:hypothetical protein